MAESQFSKLLVVGSSPTSRSTVLLFKGLSAAQLRAGNYPKRHAKFQGLDISIENERGSMRSGTAKDGKKWSVKMAHPYGYIRRSEGMDGEHVDCFVGPKEDATHAYVVHQHQIHKVRAWPGDVCPHCLESPEKCWHYMDEDKCMLGFSSEAEAKTAYLSNYDDRRFLGPITAHPMDEFKEKVRKTLEEPGMVKAAVLFLTTRTSGSVTP